jgi:hypothetical protein
MALTLTITPKDSIIASMPDNLVRVTPVLLGLDAEAVGGDVKFLIDVVFQRIRIKAPLGMGPWYAALMEAEITLRANGAKIDNHSKGRYIEVKHEIKTKTEKTVKAKLDPKIEVSEKVTVSLLDVGAERMLTDEETLEFSERESQLAPKVAGDRITWLKSSTHGPKAIREYIYGNLHLWAECKWDKKVDKKDRRGSVMLEAFPELFRADGKKFSKIGSFFANGLLKFRPPVTDEQRTKVQFVCNE